MAERLTARGAWALVSAVAVYWTLAAAQALSIGGLQYDEALMVLGSVHLRHSREILPLPQDPDTWTCAFGRCFPLMTVRYVGAFKEYLTLPFMALFGGGPAVVRLVSIAWAGLAVWGVGRFAGPLAAFLLAICPAFVDQTAFDNGAVVGWSGALGLCLAALCRYRESPSVRSALALGAAAGLGLWCRANFAWLIIAVCIAAAPSAVRWVRNSRGHVLAAIGAAFLASFPFWIYQVISRGGTFEAAGMFRAEGSWPHLVWERFWMFARVLISDLEHRAIWSAGELPSWQPAFCAGVFLAAFAMSIWQGGLARQAAVTLGIFYLFLFSSRLPVAEHHFVPALPLAAIVVGMGARSFPPAKWLWAGSALLYLTLAIYWNFAAWRGLRQTGGAGQWSDAIVQVNQHLSAKKEIPGGKVRILDWGLQNNLFVLSDSRLRTVEDFGTEWSAKLAAGGLFLTNGPANTFYAAPREAFLQALAQSGKSIVPTRFLQRGGEIYAELWEVPPGEGNRLLEGFHGVETGGWRWTQKHFAVQLLLPAGQPRRVRAELFFPDILVQKLGPVTLTARAADKMIGARTFTQPGEQTFEAALPDSPPGPVRVDFHLDKALPPGGQDNRELGLIVKSIGLSAPR